MTTGTTSKKVIDLSQAQKKLIAESLAQIAVNLASANRPIPETTMTGVRTSLTKEFLALNAPAAPKEGA